MTNRLFKGLDFETEFSDFEKNRMYPPNHTGEIMITMKPTHMMSVSRAIHFVNSGIIPSMQPKHRESIEKDIQLLKEVHGYILQQIKEPGLPMSPETVGQGNNGEKKPVDVVVVGETYGQKNNKS